MRVNWITIKRAYGRFRLEVIRDVEELPDDYNPRPDPNKGFYKCPAKKPIDDGIEELKDVMIMHLINQRDEIDKQIDQLRNQPLCK